MDDKTNGQGCCVPLETQESKRELPELSWPAASGPPGYQLPGEGEIPFVRSTAGDKNKKEQRNAHHD